MAKSDLQRRAEQIRDEMEDLRSSIDDVLGNYNKLMSASSEWWATAQGQMTRAARKARGNVAEVSEELAEAGIPWWVPVAAIAAVGLGFVVANMLGIFGMRPAEESREQFTPNVAGQQPPFGMTGQP